MTVHAVVVGHPSRSHWHDGLTAALGATLVLDEGRGRWDTHRRALLAGMDGASAILMIQDDAIVPPGTMQAAHTLAQHAPVSLYLGGLRPRAKAISKRVESAPDGTLLYARDVFWAVALLLPAEHVDGIIETGDRRPSGNVDHRIGRFYRRRGIDVAYTVPSLVDHRPEAENPSTIPGRRGNRVAHRFAGDVDVSGFVWTPGGRLV